MSKIHSALIEAMREIAKTGIAKTSKADFGGAKVNYRGIEAAMNEMSVILIKCGISVTPTYSDLVMFERAKGEGKATRFATVKGAFTFTAAEDESSVKCEAYGEAMDSGDKAVTKAQSVAFRTALFQQFVVPTMAMDPEEGGDGDDAILNDECRERVKNAQTEEELRALSKEYVPLFNKAHDREGYAEFVTLIQARGAEVKARTREVAHA
jgi:hypothetical protein